MSNRRLVKAGVSVLFVAGLVGGTASAAGAAQPVVQACVGASFSEGAAALPGGDLGQTVRGLAQAPDEAPGIGNGIQATQAGEVPDDVAINACN